MNEREKLISDHPLPWQFVLNMDSHDCNEVRDAKGNLVLSEPYNCDQEALTFMVGAVNRLYGPILCPKCDKPSGQRDRLWLCQDCRDAHIKDLQSDIHLYQSAEHRASREADFNKDT